MMKIKEKLKNKVGSEKAKELLVNSFWSILGSIISKGLVFLAWILVGRILGKEDYGSFGIIRNTVIMFTSFAGLGLGLTASKFVAEFLHSDKAKVERILGLTLAFGTIMGAIIGVFTLIFSSYLAKDMLHAPALVFDLQIASIILFFSSLNGAQIGALQGLQAFKKLASINTWQAICSFPLFIVG
ncbi:MAG: oligosaccharide flippase family protein, partial [Tannerellaceae bacterium]